LNPVSYIFTYTSDFSTIYCDSQQLSECGCNC